MFDAAKILVQNQFQFLINDLGFRVIASKDFPSSFGNMLIDLSNGSLNVRIVRDRGIVDAEVSPSAAPDQSVPLTHLRQIVLQRDLEDVTIDEQARFLQSHYQTVVEMLSAANIDNMIARVSQLGRDYWKKKFPGQIRD